MKITEYGPAVTAEVQPKDASYVEFGTAEFNLPTGAYELKFEGLNPNGGNNTALIDSITLNNALVPGGDFEAPEVEEDTVAPADSGWNYLDSAGIASANGELMHDGHPAPSGNQAAFITNTGTLWQYGTVTPLTYTLNFQAAQFFGNDSAQTLRVMLRGATSTKTFVWSGNTIAEERDATGANVTKRYFAEGEQRIGEKATVLYYYSRDHLGSIREVTNENGELVAQYDYDVWGKRVTLTGNPNFDFGFTGHYFHQPSGINLTMYRAYSPALGRWISRDLLRNAEMSQGPNLYAYVRNDPARFVDPLGLATVAECYQQYQAAMAAITRDLVGNLAPYGVSFGLDTVANAGLGGLAQYLSLSGRAGPLGIITAGFAEVINAGVSYYGIGTEIEANRVRAAVARQQLERCLRCATD